VHDARDAAHVMRPARERMAAMVWAFLTAFPE
jgi:hypothetical protein